MLSLVSSCGGQHSRGMEEIEGKINWGRKSIGFAMVWYSCVERYLPLRIKGKRLQVKDRQHINEEH